MSEHDENKTPASLMCGPSRDVCRLTPFMVMEILEAAHALERAGRQIIHLEVGEPDFDTPPAVVRAAKKALDSGMTHYTHSLGIPELREAVAEHYSETYGLSLDPARVVITSGTSPAMFMLFSALCEPGDNVLLSDPHYACYPNFIRFAKAEPRTVRTMEEDGFQLDPEAVREAMDDRTRAVFINSPSNPTGNLLSPERMRAIADLGTRVVSDEIYHGLVYGEREHSILEFSDEAFVLNGFSKLYAMTGWRLGYMIAPENFVRALQTLCQNFFISANSIAQWAGVAALRETAEDVRRMREVYNVRREFMIKRLKEIGFGISVAPRGAFYVLANARFLGEDSMALAFDILRQAGVGVTPGIDFGAGAEGYLRFSYANSLENIEEGMNRLQKYVEQRSGV
jgi:aspartate/methionine/tyrosine aminotransferase